MSPLYRVVSALAMLSASAGFGADFPTLPNDSWYRVEVIIFERLAVVDATATQEVVAMHAPRAFPLDIVAFDDDASRAAVYPLDAETRGQAASVGPSTRSANRPAQAESPLPSQSSPAERATEAIAQYQAQLQARSYQFESSNTFLLTQEDGRLQRSNAYRVVFHRAWIQPVPDRDELLPVLIQAGDRIGGVPRIEGSVGVTRGRYLHLDARLWFALNADAPAPNVVALDSAVAESALRYTELSEQRRMRSGELHYLDHPRFGVLARIDPVQPPEALLAELARLGAPTVQGTAQPSPAH